MAKIAYIIPGFAEKTTFKSYQHIIKFFKLRKFKVIPVKISWKYRVMSDYVKEFLSQVKQIKNNRVCLFGFSFGAMIALISSLKIKPKMLFLCSLSPYFKEDIKYLKKSWKKIMGKRQISDLKNFSFNDLSKKIKCRTILVFGTKEGKETDRRIDDACKRIKNNELILIQNAKHKISQKEYINTLQEVISKL